MSLSVFGASHYAVLQAQTAPSFLPPRLHYLKQMMAGAATQQLMSPVAVATRAQL